MRFLITMNMPSASGNTVHQVTVDHKSASLSEFCEILNADIFVTCRNFYRRTDSDGTMYWEDRGDIILNSSHIGKVQIYIEQERTSQAEDAYFSPEKRNFSFETKRGPIRPRK